MRECSLYGLNMEIEELREKGERMLAREIPYTGADIADLAYLIDVCQELIAYKEAEGQLRQDVEKMENVGCGYGLGFHHSVELLKQYKEDRLKLFGNNTENACNKF